MVVPNLGEAEGVLHGRSDEAVDAAPDARPRAEQAAPRNSSAAAPQAAVVTAAAAGAAVAWGGEPVWIDAPPR